MAKVSGSIPSGSTNNIVLGDIKYLGSFVTFADIKLHEFGSKVFMDARMPVTHKEGDRYPLRPPNLFPMSNLGEGSGLLIREAWFESTSGSHYKEM